MSIQTQSIKLNNLSFLSDRLLNIRFYFCSYFHIVSIITPPGQKEFRFSYASMLLNHNSQILPFKTICPRKKRISLKFICAHTVYKSPSYRKHHVSFRNITSVPAASILSVTTTTNVSSLKINDFGGAFVNKSCDFCA